MEPFPNPTPLQIGDAVIDPSLHRIRRSGEATTVEPRVMAVLMALVAAEGGVVSRDELMETVWGGTSVSDNSLTQAISELRRLLGDDPRSPHIIETIRKRGYRLVAPVAEHSLPPRSPSGNGPPVAEPHDPATAAPPPASTMTSATAPASSTAPWRWGLVVLIAAALTAAGFLFLRPSPPAPSPVQPMMSAETGRWVTSLPGREVEPSLSSDGQHLIFVHYEGLSVPTDLWHHELDGAPPSPFTQTPGWEFSPTFSPDGERIAYFYSPEPGTTRLQILPLVGGEPEILVTHTNEGLATVSWSPDGRYLVYHYSPPDQGGRLRIFDLATQEDAPLLPPRSDYDGDLHPSWSPTGEYIAFVRLENRLMDLYVMRWSDRSVRRLTADSSAITDITWLDEQTILFPSFRKGSAALWQLDLRALPPNPNTSDSNASGSNTSLPEPTPFLPTAGSPEVTNVMASSDGRTLIYEQRMRRISTHIYSMTAGESPTTRPRGPELFPSSRQQVAMRPSPVNTSWAFLSDRDGRWGLWIADDLDAAPRKLEGIEGLSIGSSPRWSPDGRYLAFSAEVDDEYDIWVVRVDNGRLQQITDEPEVDLAPSWSADSRSVLFASQRGGQWKIWQQQLTAGGPTLRVAEPAFIAKELEDGTLYYLPPDARGLWRVPPADGASVEATGSEPEWLDLDIALSGWGNWSVVNNAIYFAPRNHPNEVRHHDLSTGVTETIVQTEKIIPNHGAAVLPGGREIAIATLDADEGDLVLLRLGGGAAEDFGQ